jgi:hypothetical protein
MISFDSEQKGTDCCSRGCDALVTCPKKCAPEQNTAAAPFDEQASFRSILTGDVHAPKSTLGFMKAVEDAGHAGTIAEVRADQK